jgi:hypothetical protein
MPVSATSYFYRGRTVLVSCAQGEGFNAGFGYLLFLRMQSGLKLHVQKRFNAGFGYLLFLHTGEVVHTLNCGHRGNLFQCRFRLPLISTIAGLNAQHAMRKKVSMPVSATSYFVRFKIQLWLRAPPFSGPLDGLF